MVLQYGSKGVLSSNKLETFSMVKPSTIWFNDESPSEISLEKVNSYTKALQNATTYLKDEHISREQFEKWLFDFLFAVHSLGIIYSNPFSSSQYIGVKWESFVVNSVLIEKVSRHEPSFKVVTMDAYSKTNVTKLCQLHQVPIVPADELLEGMSEVEISLVYKTQTGPRTATLDHEIHPRFSTFIRDYFDKFSSEYNKFINNKSPDNQFAMTMITQTDVSAIVLDKLLSFEFFKKKLPSLKYDSSEIELPQYRFAKIKALDSSGFKFKIFEYFVRKKEKKAPVYDRLPHWTYIRDVAILYAEDVTSDPY
ncbi:hypothetical protein WICPIJ_002661 [Wickerhamomyces pijperi]|uniref:Uncharacterized protein n=1 Tax=Wickerhamomyces pijperi TaxID=599730 RepID=A0A9P8QBE6_WICPI|nr:hypothetical protein WICPIJ_002661 [Wickerhamomyces pijperi]